jgi:hypothetical protein
MTDPRLTDQGLAKTDARLRVRRMLQRPQRDQRDPVAPVALGFEQVVAAVDRLGWSAPPAARRARAWLGRRSQPLGSTRALGVKERKVCQGQEDA